MDTHFINPALYFLFSCYVCVAFSLLFFLTNDVRFFRHFIFSATFFFFNFDEPFLVRMSYKPSILINYIIIIIIFMRNKTTKVIIKMAKEFDKL